MPFQQHEQTGLVWFTADVLNDVPHGFSTRKGGVSPAPWDSLNLRPGQGDGPEKLWENYRRFFATLGLDETRAVLSQQTHTANIRTVTAEDAGKGLLRPRDYTDVDALITNVPNLPLTVFSADCGIIYASDAYSAKLTVAATATADMCGLTALALGFSMSFANFLAMQQIPQKLASWMTATFSEGWMVLAFILVILLIVGCFVDNISSCLILAPVLLPVVKAYGIGDVHFGIIMTVALAIGFVTPPYGCNLFTASAIAKLSIERIAKAAIPFIIAMFICLLLITYIEPICMTMVRMLG